MNLRSLLLVGTIVLLLVSCNQDEEVPIEPGLMQMMSLRVGSLDIEAGTILEEAPVDMPVVGTFSDELDTAGLKSKILLTTDTDSLALEISYLDQNRTFSLRALQDFEHASLHTLTLEKIQSSDGLKEFPGGTFQFQTKAGQLILESITIDGIDLNTTQRITNISLLPTIQATFSEPLDPETVVPGNLVFNGRTGGISMTTDLGDNGKTISITPTESLEDLIKHVVRITNKIKGENGFIFEGSTFNFYTQLDSTHKFPETTEEELLTKIQQESFKFFWDFGHPVSGLSRERNTSGDLVTSGGSGFGLMAIPVGIERGFITRQEGVDRIETIVDFLGNADRFHGVWSHWFNGTTGEVIPFSQDDNGGDIVETSYLVMGLLTVRQYLDPADSKEDDLIVKINDLWESVEWNWHVQEGNDVLTWHWSPNFGFQKNHSIRGWNEALITYIMAASSTTYPIEASVYHNGWARGGDMQNGNSYYDITLPLGTPFGGPLFFAHYTFVGIDPRNLEDQYANYWEQNVNHTLINRAHSIQNPNNWVGYSSSCWGLTASDNHQGYNAHSPNNDLGVITPTAALSSFPYTPEYSMDAIEHFYYLLGDRIWGEYGFHDAFNITENWYASSYLAIDQGPIILMIENHRSGLLWDLFMSCPEVQDGLDKLGFTY